MRLSAWTYQNFFDFGKAVFRSVTGVQYPFHEKSTQRAVLMVQSLLAASSSMEMLRAVKAGSLDQMKGVLLERRALDNEAVKDMPTAARVTGNFRPIGGSWPTDISIPPDTTFVRKATATQSEIVFRSEGAGLITATQPTSNQIQGVCTVTGTRGNGIPASTALSLRNPIAGVADFYTTTESAGGRARGSDEELRAEARENRKGHGQTTWNGIESQLKKVELSGSQQIKHCRVFEAFDGGAGITIPPSPVGIIYCIIDNGTGELSNIGPLDTTTYGPYDNFASNPYWEYESQGSIIEVQLPYHVIDIWNDGVNAVLQRNNGSGYVSQTYETDYWVNNDNGRVVLATPLTIGQSIRVQFAFYTSLIEEAAKKLYGVRDDAENRGFAPCGYSLRLRAPFAVSNPTVAATLAFKPGFDSDFGRASATASVQAYLNNLGIGESAKYNKINSILHNTIGVDTVDGLLVAGTASDFAATHPYGVVRGNGAMSF